MKYLKTYEQNGKPWNWLQDYYVVVKDEKYPEFFDNNVGRVTKCYWIGWFAVSFDNPPKEIKKYLEAKNQFHRDHIVFYSKNREDCEEFIDMNQNIKRFNL